MLPTISYQEFQDNVLQITDVYLKDAPSKPIAEHIGELTKMMHEIPILRLEKLQKDQQQFLDSAELFLKRCLYYRERSFNRKVREPNAYDIADTMMLTLWKKLPPYLVDNRLLPDLAQDVVNKAKKDRHDLNEWVFVA